jgi:hypothetical protein
MTALLSLEMEDIAAAAARSAGASFELAGGAHKPPDIWGLVNPGPGHGGEPDAGLVWVTAGLLMRGHLRLPGITVARLSDHESSDSAAQGQGRGENSAHHANTNGPGRPSPAVTARRPAAVP